MDLNFCKKQAAVPKQSMLNRKRHLSDNTNSIPMDTVQPVIALNNPGTMRNMEQIDFNNDSSIKDATSENNIRKSQRNKKKESEIEIMYCHQCKKLDIKEKMYTCGNVKCRESFCLGCIRKNSVKYSND